MKMPLKLCLHWERMNLMQPKWNINIYYIYESNLWRSLNKVPLLSTLNKTEALDILIIQSVV